MIETQKLARKDFMSGQTVRWCPGCGDYAILAQVQSLMPALGIPREKIVFISGIGCSSRFPYYMNTYGFHTIHGRALPIAEGLKMANSDLQIWVITGDGDALSIGGNHFIHALRKNFDLKIIMFNNEIYGLTKGQYSPTSKIGQKTKSSPFGSIEKPVHPLSLALGVEATFVARTIDADPKHMLQVFKRASEHKGTAYVEVLQNCLIFNNGAHSFITDKMQRPDHALYLEHGKPLRFGPDNSKGIALKGTSPVIVEQVVDEKELLVHDETHEEPTHAYFLSRMRHPEFPVPLGVFRAVKKPIYDETMNQRIESAKRSRTEKNFRDFMVGNNSWTMR